LRFYRWRGPALSFGYFGSYAEVAEQGGDREIVRRWTGGGVVPHGADLTYSVIIPASHPFFARSSLAIYSDLHDAIREALEENGIAATLANAVSPKISEECFANAVRADVISQGQKIAGAAHRRSRAGLLHQGSIQKAKLPDRFRDDLARTVCDRFEYKAVSQELIDRAATIAEAKYGTTRWLRRR
jgi:lipoate-protein ligase A